MFFTSSYKLSQDEELEIASNSVTVSDTTNIYLIDTNQQDINTIADIISADSNAKEKTILALSNVSKAGNTLPIYYPLDIQISQDDESVFEQL